jgi:hypothetical protein
MGEGSQVPISLSEWTSEELANLSFLLSESGITHRWDGTTLVVSTSDEERVGRLVDYLLGPSSGPSTGRPDEMEDESVYPVLTRADRVEISGSRIALALGLATGEVICARHVAGARASPQARRPDRGPGRDCQPPAHRR